jgi:phage baseplate assembly protein W|tara:strand:+ start:637 stop:1068 length:432 start_codon:yes stop_codon:yes gene_type:complete
MADLYKKITVPSGVNQQPTTTNRAYKGTSTVNPNNNSNKLFDIGLIKQDLINHFHIKQGEKLMNPEFGTIIWDAIYEPLTESMKEAIAKNVTDVVNADPRIVATKIDIDSFESGIIIDVELKYLPYNISETLRLKFDEESAQF